MKMRVRLLVTTAVLVALMGVGAWFRGVAKRPAAPAPPLCSAEMSHVERVTLAQEMVDLHLLRSDKEIHDFVAGICP